MKLGEDKPPCHWVSQSEEWAEAQANAYRRRIELGNRCLTEDIRDGYAPPWRNE